MADLIAILAIVLVVGSAIFYIVRSKKKGVRCIGCPAAKNCPSAKKGGCDCKDK